MALHGWRLSNSLQPSFVSTWLGVTAAVSMGGWAKLNTTTSTTSMITVTNTSAGDSRAVQLSGGQVAAFSDDGTTSASAFTSGLYGSGDWVFFLARFINDNLRRISMLNGTTGQITGGSNTTFVSASSSIQVNFGNQPPSSNLYIAYGELWIAQGLPFANNADVDPAMVQQIAYRGPLSIPQLGLEYYFPLRNNFNFFCKPTAAHGPFFSNNWWDFQDNDGGNGFIDVGGKSMWVDHPPLPADYVTLSQSMRFMAY